MESFWSMLKRAHKGVYHRLSAKHLQRYVSEFAGRANIRDMDTVAQMQMVVSPTATSWPTTASPQRRVRSMSADSEFRIYRYVNDVLEKLGWDTRNPVRGGQVYSQSEFRKHDPMLRRALGDRVPENIVLVPSNVVQPCYWIVEAKRSHSQLPIALSEAEEYAALIHSTLPDAARFATGIAGSPHDSFYVSTRYWDGDGWHDVAINDYETTGFLSPAQCRDILQRNSPNILDYDIDLDAFLRKANDINKTLHRNGVAARDRARLVAGLLLALAQQADLTIADEPLTLVKDVNTRIEALLRTHHKEAFFSEVSLKLPTTQENHRKYWTAIVWTMQHLREMNIRSAINSGTDALGQFYETFLKYANDASEMGIVLTPRHITKFAVDVLGIRHSDTIFDPTCGTGGFLVAALDSIRERHYGQHRDVYDAFRNDCLYGVEQADDVFALALVNMIFRGDGKSRIHNGNCFDNGWVRDGDGIKRVSRKEGTGIFTKVLMNPPFAVEEKESEFVDYALGQMAGGGLLFAVLPNAPITGHNEVRWRERLAERHTIRAVVRLRDDLFYPTAHKGTYALIVEDWRPHQPGDHVFFGMLDDDNSTKKSKMLSAADARDNVEKMTGDLRAFIAGRYTNLPDVPGESVVTRLAMSQKQDFAPESYIANRSKTIRSHGCARSLFLVLHAQKVAPTTRLAPCDTEQLFPVSQVFNVKRGQLPALKRMGPGNIPVVTSSGLWNGIAGYYDVASKHIHRNAITVSANGSEANGLAFWQPHAFAASADTLICTLRDGFERYDQPAFWLYVCEVISHNAWRFDYFRKCTPARLAADVWLPLPLTQSGKIDLVQIDARMQSTPGYISLIQELEE